jgi:protein-export SecD/SecF family membrane protein
MTLEYKKKSKNIRLLVLVIFICAILLGSLDYPVFWDKAVDYLNAQFSLGLPHFYKLPFRLGLDLQGGTHLVYQADLSGIEEKERSASMDGIRDVIERRVNLFGVAEPLVQINKAGDSYRLIVELPGIKDVNQAIKMIGETPYLEFKEEGEEDFKNTPLTGRYLKKAQLEFDPTTYKPQVSLEFNDEGAKLFADITSRNVGKRVAIYLDGAPITTPVVQEAITGGKAQITGTFTNEEAKQLVQRLNSGALPVPITLIAQQSVGASLGKMSLTESLKAGIYGFLAILLFMIIFYRFPGFFASLSLIIYVLFVLAIFKFIPVTLTLAGIAGFLLSMGMAVDANILIFSRMREELKTGKSYLTALIDGAKRAWPAIRDGNFTTILVGLILFIFGTSFIKGFAFTLIIGNLISMFSAIVITNAFVKFSLGTKLEKIKWLWL